MDIGSLSSFKPERRIVAVLFGDIKGFTTLSEFLDPEDLQELIDSIFGKFKEIIEKNGGYLDKFIGDAVMAVFGAPISHGDDARRAIITAISMQNFLEEVNAQRGTDIKMRIGINVGEALWSSIAGEKPTVLGDTVNVAQRIQDIAEPGKIYVTDSVVNLTFQNFYFKDVGNVRVKGREEPVRVFEVVDEKPGESEFSIRGRFKTPFVGREEEIRKLEKWLLEKLVKPGIHFAEITGEAGIGKTRLCSEFKGKILITLPEVKVSFFKCDPIKQLPLYAFRKILEDLLSALMPHAPKTKENLSQFLQKNYALSKIDADILGTKIFNFLNREMQFSDELMKEFLSSMLGLFELLVKDIGKFVVFLDDCQFIDSESKYFLNELSKKVSLGSVVVLCISREPLGYFPVDFTIELKGLGEDFVKKVCRTVLQVDVNSISEDFIVRMLEKTKGNPYFVEELIYFLRDKGLLEFNPLRIRAEEYEIPETVTGLLVSSVDSLPEPLREILKAASVIGKHFWRGVLESISGKTVGDELNELEREGFIISQEISFIRGDFEYIFKNELLREAVYSLMTKKEREKLHRLVAQQLEKIEDKDEHMLYMIAYHYEKAGDLMDATRYYEEAGDIAFSKGFYSYALNCYRNLKETPENVYKIAQCLEALGDFENALNLLNSNIGKLDDASLLELRYEILLSGIYEKLSKFEEAFKYLEEAVNSTNPEISSYSNYKKAWVYWRIGDHENARRYVNISIEIIERYGLSTWDALKTLGADFNLLGNIEQVNDNYEKAISYYERAKSIFEEIGELTARAKILINLSQLYLNLWKLDVAESYLQEALSVIKNSGSRFLLAVVMHNLGRVYFNKRDLEKAKNYYEEARKIFLDLKLPGYVAESSINLANIYLELFDFEKGKKLLDEVVLSYPDLQPSRIGIIFFLSGVLNYRLGKFKEAKESFIKSEEIFAKLNDNKKLFQVRVYRAVLECLLGDCDSAVNFLKEAKELEGSFELGLRKTEAFLNGAIVEYICRGKINYLDFETLSSLRSFVEKGSDEMRISWLAVYSILGGKVEDEYRSLIHEEPLKLLIDFSVFPKIKDQKSRGYLFGMLKERGSHLLLEFLKKLN